MSDRAPAISIVMAAHNEERHLPAALGSLLRQSFGDFELICIDDGSNDSTPAILKACRDSRLIVLTNESALGLTPSLNRALRAAKGRYIARADADDLYHPERLRKQMDFLGKNPGHVAVSSAAIFIDDAGNTIGRERMPQDDLSVRWRCLFNSPFMHPAVMLRAETLRTNQLFYDESCKVAQDYELWSRLLAHGKGANLRERLYIRRDRPSSISSRRLAEQHGVRDAVSKKLLERQFPGRGFDMAAVDRLRAAFINRQTPAIIPSRVDIAAYKALLREFMLAHQNHPDLRCFRRAELLGQAQFFLRVRRLAAALPFIREYQRVLMASVAGRDLVEAADLD